MDGRNWLGSGHKTRIHLLACLGLACLLSEARAQSTNADSVEAVRQILRNTNIDARLREQYLRQQIDQVHGVVELRQAIGLVEWRDQEAAPGIGAIDQAIRGELC